MDERAGRLNVLLYRLYVIFNEPLFWGPILIVSLQRLAGMSLPEIYYMEAVVLCICVVLDIPSGALADMIGKKRTIVIGRVFLLGSVTFFATMRSPLDAWIGNILWAIGYTLQSGADSSLLYETLKERGKEDQFRRIQGQAVGGRLLLVAFCALVVGVLAEIDLRLPLLLCIPFALIPLGASLFWREPTKTEGYSVQEQLARLAQGASFVLRSVEVRWMVGFAALIMSTSKVWFFTYNPYFELVGVPIAQYGVIFFLLNMVAFLSSHYAYKIEALLGEKGCVVLAVLCVGGPILLMSLVPIPLFAYLVVVQNVVRGFLRPFFEDFIHHHISEAQNGHIRATVMSTQSTVANVTAISGLAAFGVLTGRFTLLTSLTILGVVCLALGWWSYRSYIKKIA
jgi:MFS family permease